MAKSSEVPWIVVPETRRQRLLRHVGVSAAALAASVVMLVIAVGG
jgi:hypothetical protein